MVEIREIAPSKKELIKFVKFGIDLYKGNDCFVPPLILDDVNTLRPDKNPAFDYCQAQSFMAFRDGKPVGRITAIINSKVQLFEFLCLSLASWRLCHLVLLFLYSQHGGM